MESFKDMTAEEMKKELAGAQEIVRAFKFAFPGTPARDLKAYREARKKVAQLLTLLKANAK